MSEHSKWAMGEFGGEITQKISRGIMLKMTSREIVDTLEEIIKPEIESLQSQLTARAKEIERLREAINKAISNWDGTNDSYMYGILQTALKQEDK